MLAGLLEVDQFKEWPKVDYPGDPAYPFPAIGLRYCDLCDKSLVDQLDITFYLDPAEGLSVCEHCVAEYLTEKP